MKVTEILRDHGHPVFAVPADRPILDAIRILVDRNIGSLLVTGADGQVAGLLTERDVLRACDRRHGVLGETVVGEVMTRNPPTATPDDDLDELQTSMTERRVRHLPIVQDGRVVGLVSLGDLVKTLHRAAEMENRDLKDYIAGKYTTV